MNAYYKGQPVFGPRGPAGPDGNPIGTIISYIGITAPKDYLVCDGIEYAIADYPDLAAFFEAQFGAANYFGGDGRTTFAVPDMRNLYTSQPVNMAVLYCIKAVESVPTENVYSTEEQRIGRWMDGKPLYRKVFQGTIPETARRDVWYDLSSIPEAETAVNITGKIKNGEILYFDTGIAWCFIPSSKIIKFKNYADSGFPVASDAYEIIVEYTKTTD